MIVIACRLPNIENILVKVFEKYAPPNSFCLPDSEEAQFATVAACWFPDLEQLKTLPQVKVIHSIAAGVEHLNLDLLTEEYQVCRVIDEHHQKGMFDYLQWAVLYYQRQFDRVQQQQKQMEWKQLPQYSNAVTQVGIMGLGHMGGYVSKQLAARGYAVSGWSRTRKEIPQVTSYAGDSELSKFLSQSKILINLLPLTSENHSILSAELFNQLPEGASLINCGRGQHVVKTDLIQALDRGQLRGAILDVFDQEPLLSDDEYWVHEKIIVTPHIASHAPMSVVVAQILENQERLLNNEALKNQIDLRRGY